MPGRPPKPTNLKLVEGNPGKRPLNLDEPQPQAGAPEPPDWLDPVAKAKWHEVCGELVRIGVLTAIDGAALAGYAQSYARWAQAERTIAAEGSTYESHGRTGRQVKMRPEVRIAAEAMRSMKAFAEQLGLTPSARVRLKGEPAQLSLFGDDDQRDFN